MTNLTQYEKGCSPCAIQRKYGLTYEQGYELAERLKKTQELELGVRRENTKLKKLLKECKTPLEVYNEMFGNKEELLTKINQVLGDK